MHRPRAALLVAVVVAAACLSSPPASQAARPVSLSDAQSGFGHSGFGHFVKKNGDSDQFTTKSQSPPVSSSSTPGLPGSSSSGSGSSTGSGTTPGNGHSASQDGLGGRAVRVGFIDFLMRALSRTFWGFLEQ